MELEYQSPVVQLAYRLINIESISGQEQSMAHYLQEYLTENGWCVELQEVPLPSVKESGQKEGSTTTTATGKSSKNISTKETKLTRFDILSYSYLILSYCCLISILSIPYPPRPYPIPILFLSYCCILSYPKIMLYPILFLFLFAV